MKISINATLGYLEIFSDDHLEKFDVLRSEIYQELVTSREVQDYYFNLWSEDELQELWDIYCSQDDSESESPFSDQPWFGTDTTEERQTVLYCDWTENILRFNQSQQLARLACVSFRKKNKYCFID